MKAFFFIFFFLITNSFAQDTERFLAFFHSIKKQENRESIYQLSSKILEENLDFEEMKFTINKIFKIIKEDKKKEIQAVREKIIQLERENMKETFTRYLAKIQEETSPLEDTSYNIEKKGIYLEFSNHFREKYSQLLEQIQRKENEEKEITKIIEECHDILRTKQELKDFKLDSNRLYEVSDYYILVFYFFWVVDLMQNDDNNIYYILEILLTKDQQKRD
jgi:hypothetical protein